MNVTVKLLGRYKTLTGKDTLTIQTMQGDTVWHVIDAFIKQYPKLEKDKNFMIISKNNVYVNRDTKIKEGEEITILPPVVSGG